jgi:hypothetical protein
MGRLSTIDLLVLTGLDQLLFQLKTLFSYITKQAFSIWRSTELSLPFQSVFPGPWLDNRMTVGYLYPS